MKRLLALLGAMAVASVVALVVAIAGTRDPIPGRLRTCVQDAQGGIVRGQGDLDGQARSDIDAGAVVEVSRTRLGDDTAVLFQGTGFRLLVLGKDDGPPLTGDLPRRVYRQTGDFALVAREIDPLSGVLANCISSAGRGS